MRFPGVLQRIGVAYFFGALLTRSGSLNRQVMILVDGVKINNATWRAASRSKEQLNLIDTSSIERIEIVRGVVSVLGFAVHGSCRPAPSSPMGGIDRDFLRECFGIESLSKFVAVDIQVAAMRTGAAE